MYQEVARWTYRQASSSTGPQRQVSEGEPGRGTTFVQVYTKGDKTFETSVVISVYEPARTLAFTIGGQPFLSGNREDQAPPIPVGFVFNIEPIWLSYVLIPLADGTRLTCTIGVVDTRGDFYRLLNELFFAKALDKALKEDLGQLKALLESRPVPLTPETLQEGAERVTRRFLGIFPYKEVHQHPVVKEIPQELEDLAW
jgi:hypothetical protein